jgi:hypothetical protein
MRTVPMVVVAAGLFRSGASAQNDRRDQPAPNFGIVAGQGLYGAGELSGPSDPLAIAQRLRDYGEEEYGFDARLQELRRR